MPGASLPLATGATSTPVISSSRRRRSSRR